MQAKGEAKSGAMDKEKFSRAEWGQGLGHLEMITVMNIAVALVIMVTVRSCANPHSHQNRSLRPKNRAP